jgi:hypothetical protein
VRPFGFVPGFGDIEVAIATSEIFHILGPVSTGADDVLVELPVFGSQPAGTAHITITLFIEKVAFGFLGLF